MKTIIVGIVLLVLVACSSDDAAIVGGEMPVNRPIQIGDKLEFPDGWTPILLTSINEGVYGSTSGFLFVCQNGNEYRYCTPKVTDDTP